MADLRPLIFVSSSAEADVSIASPSRCNVRRIGAGADEVVFVAGIKALEIDLVIDEVVQGMFDSARQKLALQIDSKQTRAGVDYLVACHFHLPKPNARWSLDIPFGSQQNAPMI